MMLMHCHCGETRVRLVQETYDALARVFVGELVCPACGSVYLDQRTPTVQRPAAQTAPAPPSLFDGGEA